MAFLAHLINGDLIRQITLTGTAAELRERIGALRDAGYRQLTIQLVPGQEQALDDWARVIEGVNGEPGGQKVCTEQRIVQEDYC